MYDLRTLITLTNDLILDDIAGFEQRIQITRKKLAVLPKGHLPYTEHKNREKQHRELQADISHIENLIKYANEGIELRQRFEHGARIWVNIRGYVAETVNCNLHCFGSLCL